MWHMRRRTNTPEVDIKDGTATQLWLLTSIPIFSLPLRNIWPFSHKVIGRLRVTCHRINIKGQAKTAKRPPLPHFRLSLGDKEKHKMQSSTQCNAWWRLVTVESQMCMAKKNKAHNENGYHIKQHQGQTNIFMSPSLTMEFWHIISEENMYFPPMED